MFQDSHPREPLFSFLRILHQVVDEHFVSLKEEAGRKTKLQGTFLGATIHPGPGFYWHTSVGIGAARLPGYTPQDKRQIGVLHQSLPGNGFFLIDWANGFKSQHQRVDEGKCVFTLISPGVFGFYDPAELPALESGTQQDPPVVLKTGDFVQFKFGYPQRELNAGGRVAKTQLFIYKYYSFFSCKFLVFCSLDVLAE